MLALPVPAAFGAAVALLGLASVARLMSRHPSGDAHQRGAIVHAARGLRRSLGRRRRAPRARSGAPAQLRIGGVAIAEQDETKHFKLIGTTGTGKSSAISGLLRTALARGDRAVIADPNGAYLERFFDRYRGDLLLNPFESRSARWDAFQEVRRAFDCEELSRSFVPDTGDASAREWRAYARTFVACVLRCCLGTERQELGELWRLVAVADPAELRRLLAGTPAQPFLDADNARMFGSIRSVAVSAMSALAHIVGQRGAGFSIRDWVAGGSGVLFLPYRASQISALRTIIGTWMRLAIFEALSGPEERPVPSARRRLWFVVDELDALGAIDGLADALARLRKFGGRCVLGCQSVAQVSSLYGGAAQTLIENCANTLILRCSASERGGTSLYASRLIGDREVTRRHVSRSVDGAGPLSGRYRRRSIQVTHQRVTEPAVLPSELEQLPDLVGYLKTASSACWTLVRIAPDARSWPSSSWA